MDVKTVPLRVKAGPEDGLEEGQFIGYASVFGNVDSYGDIVEKGAFKDTLQEWKSAGDPIPVLWGHDMQDPFSNIGHTLSAEEDDHGLKVHVQLDLESPKAVQVYRLLKGRRVSQMSFAYDVRDSEKDGAANHLKDLKLYEVSVVPIGANQLTSVLDIKAFADATAQEAKAGRVISAKNEQALRSAHEQLSAATDRITNVLSSIGGTGDDQEKASTSGQAKSDEEPAAAKSDEEPRQGVSVDDWAIRIQLATLKGRA